VTYAESEPEPSQGGHRSDSLIFITALTRLTAGARRRAASWPKDQRRVWLRRLAGLPVFLPAWVHGLSVAAGRGRARGLRVPCASAGVEQGARVPSLALRRPPTDANALRRSSSVRRRSARSSARRSRPKRRTAHRWASSSSASQRSPRTRPAGSTRPAPRPSGSRAERWRQLSTSSRSRQAATASSSSTRASLRVGQASTQAPRASWHAAGPITFDGDLNHPNLHYVISLQ
jgi:hypothetical protein